MRAALPVRWCRPRRAAPGWPRRAAGDGRRGSSSVASTRPAVRTAMSAAFCQISARAWSRAVAMSRCARCRAASASSWACLINCSPVAWASCRALSRMARTSSAARAICRRCSASRPSLSLRARSVSSRTCCMCRSRSCRATSSGFQAKRPRTNIRPTNTTSVQIASVGSGFRGFESSAEAPCSAPARPHGAGGRGRMTPPGGLGRRPRARATPGPPTRGRPPAGRPSRPGRSSRCTGSIESAWESSRGTGCSVGPVSLRPARPRAGRHAGQGRPPRPRPTCRGSPGG